MRGKKNRRAQGELGMVCKTHQRTVRDIFMRRACVSGRARVATGGGAEGARGEAVRRRVDEALPRLDGERVDR